MSSRTSYSILNLLAQAILLFAETCHADSQRHMLLI